MPNGEKAENSDGKIMTINFWRAPEGPCTIKVNNTEALFVSSVSTAFSGFVTTNSQYFTVKDNQVNLLTILKNYILIQLSGLQKPYNFILMLIMMGKI